MSSPHPDLGWVPSVFSEWPGPIAHEYHRLADLLSQSHAATNQPNYRILGAFLEMRDFAEVLIKLPTIVMIRDGDRLRLDMREIKGLLLGTPPSLGGWLEAARRAAKTLRVSADTIWTRDLVAIFLDDKGKPSSFAHLLEKVVQWRNSELGHGALRMDLDGLTNELQELVKEMNSRLATVAMRKPWNNLQIQLDGSRTPLVGFECIRRQHEGDPESGHTDREMALMCECSGKENILNLAPYAAARTCTKCNKRDVFFFNGLSGRAPNRKAQYLDYMMGHSLLPVLGNDRRWTDESADLGGLRARGAIGAKRIDENLLALLERIDLSRDYVAPTYMAEELQEFLASHDRGIVWLRAPAHTGKTVFAGHAKSLLADDPGDLMISRFSIKREYRFGLGMFNAFIDDAFYRGMPSQYHRRFQWDERGDGSMSDCFVAEAAALLERAREMSIANDRVLIILDGMDELPAPGAYGELSDTDSIADLLPPADRLPAGVYLLLTSRPDSPDETPEWVLDRMRAATSGQKHSRIIDIQRGTEGYRRLLRRCFDEQRSKASWKSGRVHFPDALFHAIGDRSDWTFLYFGLLLRLLRDGVITPDDLERMEERGERLLFAHIGRLEAVLGEKEFDRVRELLLVLAACEEAHAQAAAIVPPAFFDCDWRGVPLDELAGLLHEPYFDAGTEIKNRPGSVPLRLLFLLRSAEDLLRSHRADDSHAAYRIGLKGLVAAMRADRSHCGWAARLDKTHRRLIADAARITMTEDYAPLGPHETYLLRRGWLHARILLMSNECDSATHQSELISLASRLQATVTVFADTLDMDTPPKVHAEVASVIIDHLLFDRKSQGRQLLPSEANVLARAYHRRAAYRQEAYDDAGAIEDYEHCIRQCKAVPAGHGYIGATESRRGLALAYMNRGIIESKRNSFRKAMADFGDAINLLKRLADKDDVRPADSILRDRALAYMNRGVCSQDQKGFSTALRDFRRAEHLLERCLQKEKPNEYDTEIHQKLALLYVNRAHVFKDQGRAAVARSHYDFAIDYTESIRKVLGPDWPNDMRGDLIGMLADRSTLLAASEDFSGASRDATRAIALGESLRKETAGDYLPHMLERLAITYETRGEIKGAQGLWKPAIADYQQAVELTESLKVWLGARWSAELSHDLAERYALLAEARGNFTGDTGAVSDYGQAIHWLRDAISRDPDWQSATVLYKLARAYANRSGERNEDTGSDTRLSDASDAIRIIEGSAKELTSDEFIDWYEVAFAAYLNRASCHEEAKQTKSAMADYNHMIHLLARWGMKLGKRWSSEMKKHLAEAYGIRAELHGKTGNGRAAAADRRRAAELVQ